MQIEGATEVDSEFRAEDYASAILGLRGECERLLAAFEIQDVALKILHKIENVEFLNTRFCRATLIYDNLSVRLYFDRVTFPVLNAIWVQPGGHNRHVTLVSLMLHMLEKQKAPVVQSQGESGSNLQAMSPVSR